MRNALPGNPDTYAQNDLIDAGYPPRPDRRADPLLYATWLQSVGSATTIVHAEPVARLDRFHDQFQNLTSSDWSGTLIDGPDFYDIAWGDFVLPALQPSPSIPASASMWVGMGGQVSNDPAIIQAGVDMDVFFSGAQVVDLYLPWIEYFPANTIGLNLSANVNQEMLIEVWAADSTGHVNLNGGYGVFFVENLTTQTAIQTAPLKGPTTFQGNPISFRGLTADFIIEKFPTVPLVNFGSALMLGLTQDTNGNLHDLATDFYFDDTLKNTSNQTLATAMDGNGTDGTAFTFHQSQ